MPTTDRAFLSPIQGLLLEARNGGAVWGSGLWTAPEVLRYAHERQVTLLRQTNALVSIALVGGDANDPAIPLPIGTTVISLPGDCLRVVRVGWLRNDGPTTSSEIPEVDLIESDWGLQGWAGEGDPPPGYSVGEADSVLNARGDLNRLRLVGSPTTAEGWLEIWYTGLPALLTGAGEELTVPDVCEPALKWSTIEQMLRKVGRAEDQPRGMYAREMYEIGLEATRVLLRSWEP
jgi:hypothetical protein